MQRIVGGCNTASKSELRYPDNYPKKIVRGNGQFVYDENGKEYLDMVCSLGPIILGHHDPDVDRAVIKTIQTYGNIFSLAHPMEEELAEILHEMIPSAEMTRLMHNGKDPCEVAIRLARHITGREKVLSFSYHGCSDVFMAITKTDKGVPKCLKKTIEDVDYNDMSVLNKIKSRKYAAFILEPHTIRNPKDGYLEKIRNACTKSGTVLIFDEVVSFPRYLRYSAQATFRVTPDLTCISKGMANGFAISALVGKKALMKELRDGGVFASTTFGGNLVGVSAAIATLNKIRKNNITTYIHHLGLNLCLAPSDRVKLVGVPSRQFLECSDEDRQKIWQEMIERRVLMNVPIFFNNAMTKENMEYVSENLDIIIDNLDDIQIKGRRTNEVFKKR